MAEVLLPGQGVALLNITLEKVDRLVTAEFRMCGEELAGIATEDHNLHIA